MAPETRNIQLNLKGIDWIIVGGESGHQSRPMEKEWVIDIRNKAQKATSRFSLSSGAVKIKRRLEDYLRAGPMMNTLR